MAVLIQERKQFDDDGFLLVEELLSEAHVARLTDALRAAVSRRRRSHEQGEETVGKTVVEGDHVRIYYLLDEGQVFLDLLGFPPIMAYVHGLFDEQPHFHASDAFWQEGAREAPPGWHQDGQRFYRQLQEPTPLLQLKIAFFLSDMSDPDQGNLMVVPGSHRAGHSPGEHHLTSYDAVPGAIQVCCPPGSALLFHNALWHTAGPSRRTDSRRHLLYYAYEHRWMAASAEPVSYPRDFYRRLPEDLRPLFHPFVFERF